MNSSKNTLLRYTIEILVCFIFISLIVSYCVDVEAGNESHYDRKILQAFQDMAKAQKQQAELLSRIDSKMSSCLGD